MSIKTFEMKELVKVIAKYMTIFDYYNFRQLNKQILSIVDDKFIAPNKLVLIQQIDDIKQNDQNFWEYILQMRDFFKTHDKYLDNHGYNMMVSKPKTLIIIRRIDKEAGKFKFYNVEHKFDHNHAWIAPFYCTHQCKNPLFIDKDGDVSLTTMSSGLEITSHKSQVLLKRGHLLQCGTYCMELNILIDMNELMYLR